MRIPAYFQELIQRSAFELAAPSASIPQLPAGTMAFFTREAYERMQALRNEATKKAVARHERKAIKKSLPRKAKPRPGARL